MKENQPDNRPVEGEAGRKIEAKGAKIGEIQKIGPKTTPGSQRTAAQERAKAKATAAINKLFAGLGKKEDIVAKISGTKIERDEAFKKAFEGATVSTTGNEGDERKTLAQKDTGPKIADIGPLALGGKKKEPGAAEKAAKEAFATLTGGASKQEIVGTVGMNVEPNWAEQGKTEITQDTLAKKGMEATGKVADIGPLDAKGPRAGGGATEKPEA